MWDGGGGGAGPKWPRMAFSAFNRILNCVPPASSALNIGHWVRERRGRCKIEMQIKVFDSRLLNCSLLLCGCHRHQILYSSRSTALLLVVIIIIGPSTCREYLCAHRCLCLHTNIKSTHSLILSVYFNAVYFATYIFASASFEEFICHISLYIFNNYRVAIARVLAALPVFKL